MRTYLFYIFSFVIFSVYIGQTDFVLYESHFVKSGKVIFRLLPNSKKTFDTIRDHNLYLKRFTFVNGIPQNEVFIKSNLHPYEVADTASWLAFVRKNKNAAAFVYQNLYPEKEAIKNSKSENKLSTAKAEKQIFDMLMLSCDFYSDAAKACGLYLADSTVKNNETYEYRIGFIYHKGVNKELLKFSVNAALLSKDSLTPQIVIAKKGKVAKVKWQVKNAYFSGFNIERSEDSLSFKRLNEAPIVYLQGESEVSKRWIEHKDTLPQKNKKFYYRIKGVNLFGEESVSSNIVSVNNYPEIKSYPVIDSVRVLNNSLVELRWQMQIKTETDQIKNYLVMRSDKENGKYEVLSKTGNVVYYKDVKPLSVNFYKITAITMDNDSIRSFSKMVTVADTIPPQVPIGLKAVSDKKGNVIITWNKNKDQDLRGYKLFTANALYEEFVMINSEFITDTIYSQKLSLNNLSHYVYYTIAATDKNFNTSEKAIPIKVTRPDTIAPAKPLITKTAIKQNGVVLFFNPSLSDDVVNHQLLRSAIGDQNYSVVKKINSTDTLKSFIDTSAVLGKLYSYKLKACDNDNNCSFSNEVQIEYETGFRNSVKNMMAVADRTLHHISIQWDAYEDKVFNYTIYRASKKQPYTIIKTLEPTKLGFIDKNLNMGNTYYYRIKATLENGAETILTTPVEVEY